MEAVEKACDRGAVNAANLTELAARVKKALRDETWPVYAQKGQAIFERDYSVNVNQHLWAEMIERAVTVRAGNY